MSAALSLAALLTGCAGHLAGTVPNRYQDTFLELFDTSTTVIGYAADKEAFEKTARQVYDELGEYHKLYDIYNTYEGISNLKTINDSAGIAPAAADERILSLLEFCIEIYEMSGGGVNIAMGSVLSLWHESRQAGIGDPSQARLPDPELLKQAAGHTDISKVIIDRQAGTVYLDDPEMSLDVGVVAKGYAVEQVCRSLADGGVDNILLNVGGNVRCIGARGDGSPWQVGVQSPFKTGGQDYLCRVGLRDMSVVSSGSYQRYYTVDGQNYHHIINPDTLMPADTYVSVSILCADSGLADGLSTALFNMDLEAGLALIEGLPGVEAMWVYPDGAEAFSSGFETHITG